MPEQLSAVSNLFFASAVAWLRLHTAMVHGPLLVLLAAGALMAVLEPRHAWRWAVLLGFSIPLAHAVAHVTGAALPNEVAKFTWPFIAVVPAFIGAALGLGVRRAVSHPGAGDAGASSA